MAFLFPILSDLLKQEVDTKHKWKENPILQCYDGKEFGCEKTELKHVFSIYAKIRQFQRNKNRTVCISSEAPLFLHQVSSLFTDHDPSCSM